MASTREAIRQLIVREGSISGPELAKALGITRQAVHPHLRALIESGAIVKTGSTRAARYHPRSAAPPARSLSREFVLDGLEESETYEAVSIQLNLSRLPDNAEAIIHYAFTEILNNAIDHSGAKRCTVDITLDANRINFEIRDRGVGVFRSIADKLHLDGEPAALVELVKGKTTTMPQAHSGEGIFFVSRAADRFSLRSHRLETVWDRGRDDVFVADRRYIEGTRVRFSISSHSRTRLDDVFEAYAPEDFDYRFEKTRVAVKLLKRDYLSRSEARRLLHNLDRFSVVELDFKDVEHVGQGFADEIFRVFAKMHPDIEIRACRTSKAAAAMIAHVRGQDPSGVTRS